MKDKRVIFSRWAVLAALGVMVVGLAVEGVLRRKSAGAAVGEPKDVLTEEEIAGLQNEAVNETGNDVSFILSAQCPALDEQQTETYRRSGKIPIKVFVVLQETGKDDGLVTQRFDGSVNFLVKDAGGRVAFERQAIPLEELCPS